MTTSSSAIQRVLENMLTEHFDVARAALRPEATFRDLEIDSLSLVELVVVTENELGIELPTDSGIGHDTTLATAVTVLERACAEAAASGSSATPSPAAPAAGESSAG